MDQALKYNRFCYGCGFLFGNCRCTTSGGTKRGLPESAPLSPKSQRVELGDVGTLCYICGLPLGSPEVRAQNKALKIMFCSCLPKDENSSSGSKQQKSTSAGNNDTDGKKEQ